MRLLGALQGRRLSAAVKNYFYDKEIQLVVNYHYGVYSDRDIKMCHCSFGAIVKNNF